MSFLFPIGVYFFAAVPLLFALYLLRVRPREHTLPSLLLWQQTLRHSAARHRGLGKLRAWLSFLLQLLILLLLILAICKPTNSTTTIPQVLIFDTRSRMSATDAFGQSAFSKAKAYAESQIESAREDSPIALLATGHPPRLISSFSKDPKQLREALASLEIDAQNADPAAALHFAETLASSLGSHSQIVFLSDRALIDSPVPVLTFGSPFENFAFTTAGIRSFPDRTDLVFQAMNFGPSPKSVQLELSHAGRLLENQTLTLPPDQPRTLHFSYPLTSPETFTARLRPEDSLPADQSVTLTPSLPAPLRVLLVSPENWFVEKALRANAHIRFEMLAPDDWTPELSRSFDVTLFDRTLPTDFRLEGRFLFLDCLPFPSTDIAANPLVLDSDASHPLLRSVKPDQWLIGEQLTLTPPTDADIQTLVSSTAGPLLLLSSSPTARWIALPFPFEKSNLPLRASFPVFLQDLLTWIADRPASADSVSAPLDFVGSDLRPATHSAASHWSAPHWLLTSVWRWFALLALALLCIEWRTFHRRFTE